MKKLIVLLVCLMSYVCQAQEAKICFPRKGQASRQTRRLNIYHSRLVEDPVTKEKVLDFKYFVKCDSVYCVDLGMGDFELEYGVFNRLVVKPRHVKKDYVSSEYVGFALEHWVVGYKRNKLFQKRVEQ